MVPRSVRALLACFQLFCLLLLLPRDVFPQESSVQTTPQPGTGFTADFTSKMIFNNKEQTILSGKLYTLPPRVRFEPHSEEEDEAYGEVQLYDFEDQKMRRVFFDDKIFFQIDLTERNRFKAMLEGWIPWKDLPNTKRRKIKLKEDLVNGHPCILYLQERKIEAPADKKSSFTFLEYSLIWEAADLKELPVRVIYFLPNQRTVVVDYKNARLSDMDPTFFQPPEGFLNLSPF
jgi:hypothetical protein